MLIFTMVDLVAEVELFLQMAAEWSLSSILFRSIMIYLDD